MSYKFTKTEKQKEAIKLLAGPARHICLFGGARAGKTAIILYALIVRACKVKSRHAILRHTFNSAKRSIWLDSLPTILNSAFPDLKVKWNRTDYYIEFPNQSQIFIGGLDDKERAEKILGTQYSSMFFEEASQIDYSTIQIALSRLAEKNSLAKKVYYSMNPPPKSSWHYWLFEKKLNPLDNEPLSNPDEYASLLLTPRDNIQNIDENYIKLLEAMPAKDRDRFLNGLYSESDQGAVYYEFKRERHVKEVSKQNGTIFLGLDFNVGLMACVVGQYINNKFIIFDEVCIENADTYKMTSELKRRGYAGGRVVPDSTGRNRKTSGKSDFDIIKEAGFFIESTYNPFVTDRCNNLNRLLANDKIVISPKCKRLINDLEKVVWKNNKLDQSGENKLLTHASDSVGYLCWHIDPISPIKRETISTSER